MTDASDDRTVFAGLIHAPDGSGAKLAALVVFHAGDSDQAGREPAQFRTYGSPLMEQVGRMPYLQMNTLLERATQTERSTTGSLASPGLVRPAHRHRG